MFSKSSHVFSEIFFHINWHTKSSRRMITPEIEPELHAFIRNYATKSSGIWLLGIGGIEDHLHLAIQVESMIDVADWIGKVKGASSHFINKKFGAGRLEWQRGYGVLSFAAKDLNSVLHYISHQKEHHGTGKVNSRMENYGVEPGMDSQ